MNRKVYWQKLEPKYPESKWGFSPSKAYPEYQYDEISGEENTVYDSVRRILIDMGYDNQHVGCSDWNPLGFLIKPGQTVLIKPNMVLHKNQAIGGGLDCLITHPSLVRAVADYVLIALKNSGHLIIADAPLQQCDFNALLRNSGYDKMIEFYKVHGVDLEFLDLRDVVGRDVNGILTQERGMAHDRCIAVDVGKYSMFSGYSDKQFSRLRVTNYDPDIMLKHHNTWKNEYLVAKPILDADVIINMPKPKTHRKAGITACLKNMIGINTNKEWLPHHQKGGADRGNDEYSKSGFLKSIQGYCLDHQNKAIGHDRSKLAILWKCIGRTAHVFERVFLKRDFSEGSWYGNDTIWRTIADLNMLIRYADKNGKMCSTPVREVFNIADMVISGEGEGPLLPSPKAVGMIVAGEDAVLTDRFIAGLMGFDYNKIPSIKNAFSLTLPISGGDEDIAENYGDDFNFKPSMGWRDQIEKEGCLDE